MVSAFVSVVYSLEKEKRMSDTGAATATEVAPFSVATQGVLSRVTGSELHEAISSRISDIDSMIETSRNELKSFFDDPKTAVPTVSPTVGRQIWLNVNSPFGSGEIAASSQTFISQLVARIQGLREEKATLTSVLNNVDGEGVFSLTPGQLTAFGFSTQSTS